MFIVYDISFLIFAIVYLPYLILKGKCHAGFWTRFGFSVRKGAAGDKTIWIHAVSVGEVLVVLNLIEMIQDRFPGYLIVLSTVTPAGHALARERSRGRCRVIYAPLDFSWIARKYVNALNPILYISAETEIWPNLFTCLQGRGIPIIEVNGRISDRAFAGYRKVSFLTRRVLRNVRLLCMQSEEDARRVIQLGAQGARVRVVGNLKFDNSVAGPSIKRDDLGLRTGDRLFIAGSTYPGEEDIVLDAQQSLKTEFPSLRLIIAPRHVERADEVTRLCERKGLLVRKFSETFRKGITDTQGVLILDRIGYLRDLYSLADVVFVGKSLRGSGGQNMLEPLSFGKPTLVGPRTENFRDIVHVFKATGALMEVGAPQELTVQLRSLLSDPKRCAQLGLAAQKEIARHQGATKTTLKAIEEILQS